MTVLRQEFDWCFLPLLKRVRLLVFVFLSMYIIWNSLCFYCSFVFCSETVNSSVDCKGIGCKTARGPTESLHIEEGEQIARNTTGNGISAHTPPKYPIFMVPGIAGSGLMITATNAFLPQCSQQPVNYNSPFRLWASLSLVRPPRSHQLCWLNMMQPDVDETGATYSNKKGVNIEVDRYGTAHGFDYLDYYYDEHFGVPGTAYFHRMLQSFYSMGYAEGTSLVGIPYDWRLPPWQVDFSRLKSNIESRVAAMGGAKADVLVHSLGSLVCNYFFNKVVDKEWKDKHINSYTLVAPATGGSFKAVKSLLTGYNDPVDFNLGRFLDISLIPADIIRDLSLSMGSIYALLPDIDLYGKDHVVVRQFIPKSRSLPTEASGSSVEGVENVTGIASGLELRRLEEEEQAESDRVSSQDIREERVQDYMEAQLRHRTQQVQQYASGQETKLSEIKELVAKEDMEEVIYTLGNWTSLLEPEIRTRIATATEHMKGVLNDPGVPTRCIWSIFAFPSTDIGYVYTSRDVHLKPTALLDVGDDTVPLRSLSVCSGWASTFEVKTFKNLDHMFIFGDAEFNSYIQLSFGSQSNPND